MKPLETTQSFAWHGPFRGSFTRAKLFVFMELTPTEENHIRADEYHNSADAIGVAPYVAAEIAMCVGHRLSEEDADGCDAAYRLWANQTKQP